MRLMNKGFGWKCSGLSFLGKKIQDLDAKMAASPLLSPGCVRIDPKGGTGHPLAQRGRLRPPQGCEPGSEAGVWSIPLPACTPHPTWPRAPRLLLQVVATVLDSIPFIFTRRTLRGAGAWGCCIRTARAPWEMVALLAFPWKIQAVHHIARTTYGSDGKLRVCVRPGREGAAARTACSPRLLSPVKRTAPPT